jgi:hypothetical protein
MRYLFTFVLVAMGSACGMDQTDDGIVHMTTHDITVMPGEETLYCYYLHTPNTDTVAINRWVSEMTPGGHHAIMFVNPSGIQPADGTIEANCAIVGTSQPIWTFATQSLQDEMDLPLDDGEGKPVGQTVGPNTAVYIQIHVFNTRDEPLYVHIDLKGYEIPKGTAYTRTAAYLAYNNSISIPPDAVHHVESATCALPPNAKFVSMVTHSHKQTVNDHVMDGNTMVFENTDWEHPQTKFWAAQPFYQFTSPTITWACTYDNTGSNANKTLVTGPSTLTNEMCMVASFYFPANDPTFCVWDTSIPGGCACQTSVTASF